MKTYKTAEVAAAIGIHPNTVRLYEELELIPRPERLPNGYRVFTEFHIEQIRLARLEVWEILSDLKEAGMTIFLTSHFMDEVEELCDGICILKRGKTVFYGTVFQAIADSPYEKLEDAYLWYTDEEDTAHENL